MNILPSARQPCGIKQNGCASQARNGSAQPVSWTKRLRLRPWSWSNFNSLRVRWWLASAQVVPHLTRLHQQRAPLQPVGSSAQTPVCLIPQIQHMRVVLARRSFQQRTSNVPQATAHAPRSRCAKGKQHKRSATASSAPKSRVQAPRMRSPQPKRRPLSQMHQSRATPQSSSSAPCLLATSPSLVGRRKLRRR
jgi:hypothetical protein